MAEVDISTKEGFSKEVLESDLPVLVDFWASWCIPCQNVAPVLEELAKEYKNKVKICKVNIDEARDLATDYEIMSIPNLIFFRKGKKVEQIIGFVEKDKIKNLIEEKLL